VKMPVVRLLSQLNLERRRRGVSNDALASAVGVSSPTMSRWLRGQGLTLASLTDICEVLDIDLASLAKAAEEEEKPDAFTLRQERILAADRTLSLVFFLILNGAQPDEIACDFSIASELLRAKVDDLLRLGLASLSRSGRYVPMLQRTVRWRAGGPLAIAFDRTVKDIFLKSDFGSVDAHYVSQLVRMGERARRQLAARFQQLYDEFLIEECDGDEIDSASEWSAVFMMTRPIAIGEMSDWVHGQNEQSN